MIFWAKDFDVIMVNSWQVILSFVLALIPFFALVVWGFLDEKDFEEGVLNGILGLAIGLGTFFFWPAFVPIGVMILVCWLIAKFIRNYFEIVGWVKYKFQKKKKRHMEEIE